MKVGGRAGGGVLDSKEGMKADRRRDEEELTAGMSRWRAGVKVFLAFQKPPDGVLQNSSFF